MGKYVAALDQGTTSSRCILFDQDGAMYSVAQKEFKQYYPQPGWVEQDPMEIWSSQLSVFMEAMGQKGISADEIAAIGIANQRETTIVWEKQTGKPIYPAIVWQCRRTADRILTMKEDGMDGKAQQKTGLIPDAYFSATKVAWILDQVPNARERAKAGELLFGTVDTWLIWNLTKGETFVTDVTNASRTMLFDIHKLEWDTELLDYFEIPKEMLPKVCSNSEVYGKTSRDLIGSEIPIAGAAGDQQSALFGQCCFEPGEVKNTYGTGCFLLMNTGEKAVTSTNGLLTTVALSMNGKTQYALEGSVFVAGAAIQWLRDELKIIETAAETELYCETVEDTAGVYVVPAFTGLGAPHWDPYARGAIVGLTRGATKAHLIRATVESLAYQVYDLIEVMEKESTLKLKSLKVDGGACANGFLMQFQSDLLDSEVLRPACIETTALGAAALAGLAVGFFSSIEDLKSKWALSRKFMPNMKEEKRKELLSDWKRAVVHTYGWAKKSEKES